jgi:large subunit ribosomal protein L15
MRKYPKKIRKFRGRRTTGYGKVGQHRKKGLRGGSGKTTQWFKGKKSYYIKQKALGFPDPDWIHGARGFHRPQDMVRIYSVNAINIKDLDNKLDAYIQEKKATKSGNTYNINLNDLNVQKILGRGQINKQVNVSVRKASERAIQKIEAAGGKVVLLSKTQ